MHTSVTSQAVSEADADADVDDVDAAASTSFHGLIQHSFALRLYKEHAPFAGEDTKARVTERFALPKANDGAEFQVNPVGEVAPRAEGELARHSPLVRQGLTTVERQSAKYLEQVDEVPLPPLPDAFQWAAAAGELKPWDRFFFARCEADDQISLNDFLVEPVPQEQGHTDVSAREVADLLAQLMAQRRSRLFGLDLANRFVNITLPHAILNTIDPLHVPGCECAAPCLYGSWLLQPIVTLRRIGHDGRSIRRMYSLNLLLVPIAHEEEPGGAGAQWGGAQGEEPVQWPAHEEEPVPVQEDAEHEGWGQREMCRCEIRNTVEAGWGLASAPPTDDLGSFEMNGPLCEYIDRLYQPSVVRRLLPATQTDMTSETLSTGGWRLTLRQASELTAFAVALRMACGSAGSAPDLVKRYVGNNVVTSLGNSRVSSVLVVDPRFPKSPASKDARRAFPGSLQALMESMSTPETRIARRRRYRLDQPFFDRPDYAIGTLPAASCLVMTVDPDKQHGRYESGLMQAGWLAYMTIGAATATGTIRGIHRELERTNLSEPEAVAGIEREVAVDLNEIYDLDITWDAYRHRYRRLRDQLGITSDYEALQSKLQALYRETAARFEARTQMRLVILTAAIVLLSVFILAGTIVLAAK